MADFKAFLRAFWRLAMECVFPAFCLGCGVDGEFLCADCANVIQRQKNQLCPSCCHVETDGGRCENCRKDTGAGFFLDSLVCVSAYEEKSLLARAIHAFKYDFISDLAGGLAGLLTEKIKETDLSGFVICPVPLHLKRLRWRGFNQAELLAADAGIATGLEVQNLLERTSYSGPQMELKKEERARNVAGAFRCVGPHPPQMMPPKVLLLDDVATTLSTLNACAKALKEAGAKTVCAIVLARAY